MKSFPLLAMLARGLKRPIAIIDTETTGFPQDKQCALVEFGCLVVYPDGMHKTVSTLINPGIPIPPDATRIHGIRDKDVINAPTITKIAPMIRSIFSESMVVGFNSRAFDLEAIRKDFMRNGLDFTYPSRHCDVREVYIAVTNTQRGKLQEVAAKYNVEPETAHCALGDAITTAGILERMLFKHGVDFVLDVAARAKPKTETQAQFTRTISTQAVPKQSV